MFLTEKDCSENKNTLPWHMLQFLNNFLK